MNLSSLQFFPWCFYYASSKSIAAKTVGEVVPGYTDVILFESCTSFACRLMPPTSLHIPLWCLGSVALVVTPFLTGSKPLSILEAFVTSLLCRFLGHALKIVQFSLQLTRDLFKNLVKFHPSWITNVKKKEEEEESMH